MDDTSQNLQDLQDQQDSPEPVSKELDPESAVDVETEAKEIVTQEEVTPTQLLDAKTIPFHPKWASGVNTSTKVINLTQKKSEIKAFYAVSHVAVIYQYKYNDMQFLVGNKNSIECLASDASGKWLVTADSDSDNSVIVWNSKESFPVYTIFNPHENFGTIKVGISQDAKYLVTISKETDPVIKFWLWTFGKEEADASYTAKSSYGPVQDVSFNPNRCTHFLITFSEAVLFFAWENEELLVTVPEVTTKNQKNYGTFTVTTYIEEQHECLTASSNGWVIIWGNTFYTVPFEIASVDNKKMFLKAIRLQKECITSLAFVDGFTVTGDVQGNIKFYDRNLKILYWCQNFSLDSIVSLSFNLAKRKYEFQDPLDVDVAKSSVGQCEGEEQEEDRSDEYEKVYAQLLPSDFTLQRYPFIVRDFIILTETGLLVYVDFLENKLISLMQGTDAAITSLDVHDEKPILCIGYENGKICTYNYQMCRPITNYTIVSSKEEEQNEISSIKYSPHGYFMACGTAGGYLWFLEPTVIKPYSKKPFIYDNSKILDIKFSLNNKYVAYYDSSMAVCLLKYYKNHAQDYPDWIFHGRYIAHIKPVTDMLFCENSRLFSISEDRYMVEYNVEKSEPGNLELISRECIMQTAYPLSFAVYDIQPFSIFFVVTSNEYKYLIITDQSYISERTILGPTLEMSIQHIAVTSKKKMLFCAGKYIGIQLLPLTGNPFKHISMIGHPVHVKNFRISNDGNYIFTFGQNDKICIMWSIIHESVEVLAKKGGSELTPYYCLIEGGVDGWLFQEMKDLFYYVQILHQGEDSPLPRKTSNKVPIIELPNLMRSVGFYPTEYELDNILYEVKYYCAENNENNEEVITFENFVKLYINHRPVKKYSFDDMKRAFNHFATKNKLSREKFADIMCSKGENFTTKTLTHCLTVLTNIDKSLGETSTVTLDNLLPEMISFNALMSDILGLEMQ